MGLDDVLIFTRMMECHNFTQAAQNLGMQKSAVSRRIALLEERLDVRLLNRTTRKLCLTEVGQACYERYRQVTRDFAETGQAVIQLQQAPSELLRTTSPIESGQIFLASLLDDFMRQYPQITAEVKLASHSVDPLQEGVDIVIVIGQPKNSTLMARRLLSTSRQLYASPDYLAAHGTPTSVAELAGHRTVLLFTDSQHCWPPSGNGLPCQRVLSCNNIAFVREAVITGAGVTALPTLVCAESMYSGRLVRLLANMPLPVGELYTVYPSRRFQTMRVKAFLDFLVSRLLAGTGRLLEPEAARPVTSRP